MSASVIPPAQQLRAAQLSQLTTQQLIDHILTLEAAGAPLQSAIATTHTSSNPSTIPADDAEPTGLFAPRKQHKRPYSEQSTEAKLEPAESSTSSSNPSAVDGTQPTLDTSASAIPPASSSTSPLPSPSSPLPPPAKQQRLSNKQQHQQPHNKAAPHPPPPPPNFDYWAYSIRHIAFRFFYLGTPFYGFSSQAASTLPTVESQLFQALLAARLIVSRTSCHYQRCGRTDRGVHAGGQLVSLWVRSRLKPRADGSVPVGWVSEAKKRREKEREERRVKGEVIHVRHLEDARDTDDDNDAADTQPQQSSDDESSEDDEKEATDNTAAASAVRPNAESIEADSVAWEKTEFDYIAMLNRHLPPTVRILSYHPVPLPFSARFSCHRRTYHYLFYRDQLDVARMRAAGALLCGKHDYRNFCSYDVTAVTHFIRRIHRVDILPESEAAEAADVTGGDELDDVARRNAMWRVEVEGKGFLYHQVRCMVSILFAIGRHEEPVDLVTRLLDTAATPHKPAYRMASEKGLILQHSRYDEVSDTANAWPTLHHSTTNLVRCFVALWQQQRQLAMEAAVVGHMAAAIHGSLLRLAERGGGVSGVSGLLSQLPFQLDDRLNRRWLCGGELLREANLQRSFEQRVQSLTGKRKERRLKVERLREEWKRKEGDMDSGSVESGDVAGGEGGGGDRMDETGAVVTDSAVNGDTIR